MSADKRQRNLLSPEEAVEYLYQIWNKETDENEVNSISVAIIPSPPDSPSDCEDIDDDVIVVPDKTTGMPSDTAGTVELTIPEDEDISPAINTYTIEPTGTNNQPSSKETTSLKSPKWEKLNGRCPQYSDSPEKFLFQ
ncbi:hypothetical protein ANN_15946 [Periplaneta americana]|uniref:Uncharacterized protein n=1 Tax=Periplaneta americana TaxID=6978 RepID=A0ABQ8SII0_PERAM|nr:hypothetical protein ANN_15946 [Periplaneta americana]